MQRNACNLKSVLHVFSGSERGSSVGQRHAFNAVTAICPPAVKCVSMAPCTRPSSMHMWRRGCADHSWTHSLEVVINQLPHWLAAMWCTGLPRLARPLDWVNHFPKDAAQGVPACMHLLWPFSTALQAAGPLLRRSIRRTKQSPVPMSTCSSLCGRGSAKVAGDGRVQTEKDLFLCEHSKRRPENIA